jgi:hypothetical protein
MIEKEVWKQIKDYEGIYEVSSLGRVKSLKFNKQRILKGGLGAMGYVKVILCKSNTKKNITVHQLVAMAFLNHTQNGHKLVIDHINDNKTDNRLENLQIVTQRFNSCKTQGKYTSKYKGVYWFNDKKKWSSNIRINGKLIYLGLFNCELAAATVYQNKLKEIL